MFKKLFMITLFVLSACSSVKDEALPITSSSEKAKEFFKIAVKHFEQGENLEAQNK